MKWSTVGAFILIAFLTGCDRTSDVVSAGKQPTVVSNQISRLDESKQGLFEGGPEKFQDSGDLTLVNFSDENHGWIAGRNSLYKTIDAGKTWSPVALNFPEGAEPTQILFRSASTGWVILQKDRGAPSDRTQWLMFTSNGGETWNLQYQATQVSAMRVAFYDDQNGWLSGLRYLPGKGVTFTHLVLRTSDGGQHWQDVTQDLVRLTSDRKDTFGDPVNDGDMAIVATGPQAASVVTASMRIAVTIDGGESWSEAADLQDGSDRQSGVRRFGIGAAGPWLAGSTDSTEGIRSNLIVQQAGNRWARRALPGFYLSDVLQLSKDEFVACGYIKKFGQNYDEQIEGAILYSRNAGEEWSVIYRNREVSTINSLASANQRDVWAVGSNGTLISLSRLSDNK
ncbi:MAG TPA: hypothetical protein VLG74_10585 [Blastocatellia bacterium]|nr:hypothetical protein [Blastocatellia bacterium]